MSENWIFFVDTNIFLDFYRFPGESAKRQLASLEKHKSILITGDQVRMEFLKNRQKVLSASIGQVKHQNIGNIPQILAETQPAKSLLRHQKNTSDQATKLKERAEKILSNPARYDPVFQTFSRIFDSNSDLNLRRPKKERLQVRESARKRFELGYPPRKSSDNSIGDAVNWEWIIHCAKAAVSSPNVMIVSRDGDFGTTLGSRAFLNDWLIREFKERVGKRRKIKLTTKLTDALKLMDEAVSTDDVEEEEKVILRTRGNSDVSLRTEWRNNVVDSEEDRQLLNLYNALVRAKNSLKSSDDDD